MENYLNYIDKFATETDVQTAVDNGELLKPYVAYIEGEDRIDWNSKKPDYSNKYFTFKITSAGTINWYATNSASTKTISYSKDNGTTWNDIVSTTGGTSINVINGDTLIFKGINSSYGKQTNTYSCFKDSTAGFYVEGNIMSLIYGDNFKDRTSFPPSSNYIFINLFQNCTGLTSAQDLILPATNLAFGCYYGMFNGCTSLTTAPELPATTLANECYRFMFVSCTSLNYIKCLALDISATYCTMLWVRNVSKSGTFVKASGVSWSTGEDGIPNNWTVQDAA